MRKIILTILLFTLTSVVNAEYRGLIEYGISGVENHDSMGSPKIGLLYNSENWEAEISWQHWFTKDGNLSDINSVNSKRSYYGQNLYSIDYRKELFESGKFKYSIGSGLSAIEMKKLDANNNVSIGSHRALLNFSATASYKLTRAINFRLSAITSLEPKSQFSPTFGTLNMGINSSF